VLDEFDQALAGGESLGTVRCGDGSDERGFADNEGADAVGSGDGQACLGLDESAALLEEGDGVGVGMVVQCRDREAVVVIAHDAPEGDEGAVVRRRDERLDCRGIQRLARNRRTGTVHGSSFPPKPWEAGAVTPRHTLLALLVVSIWGLNFLAIDFGIADVPPLVFLALRFILVAIPAVFFIKPPGIGWRNVLLIGAFLSLGQFSLLYLALSFGMPPGLASLLLQTQVVLSVIVSAILLRERPSRRQLLGILVGMAGLAVVVVGHSYAAPWLPVVILMLAALSWAIGNVLSRRAKVSSGLSLVVWSGLIVPIPSLALAMVVDSPPVVWQALSHLSWVAILSTVYTAVAASLVGYGIWNTLLAKYPTSAVVPFTLLVPVVGIIAAWLIIGEQPTLTELLGGAIMLTGLAVAVIVRAPWRARSVDPPLVLSAPADLRDEVLE